MFLLLCWWAVLAAAARLTGAAVMTATSSGENLDRGSDIFFAQFWIGLLTLASLLLAVSALGPISPPVSLGVLCGAQSLFLSRRMRDEWVRGKLQRVEWAAFALVVLAALWNATGPVELYDTALYHYQAIRWLEQTGVIPGLALIHFRLGLSSSWFALSAAFDCLLPGRGSTGAGGLAMAVAVFQLAIAAARLLSRNARRSDVFLCGALPLVFLISLEGRFQVSPSPNLPAALAAVMSGWAAFQMRRSEIQDGNLPVLLAAGAAGVKFSMLPLLAVLGGMRLLAGTGGRLGTAMLASIGLVAPLVAVTRISSGCPLFPSAMLCAQTRSSVTPAKAKEVSFIIANWARYDGPYPADAALFDGRWFRKWIRDPYNLLFTGIAILSAAVILALRGLSPAYVAGAIASAALFVTGPSVRFMAGPFGILSGCMAETIGQRWLRCDAKHAQANRALYCMALVACAILLRDGFNREAYYTRRNGVAVTVMSADRLLKPPAIQSAPARWSVSRTDYLDFTQPDGSDQCWALPLPCTPYPPARELGYCKPSAGLAGGFCLQASSPGDAPAKRRIKAPAGEIEGPFH